MPRKTLVLNIRIILIFLWWGARVIFHLQTCPFLHITRGHRLKWKCLSAYREANLDWWGLKVKWKTGHYLSQGRRICTWFKKLDDTRECHKLQSIGFLFVFSRSNPNQSTTHGFTRKSYLLIKKIPFKLWLFTHSSLFRFSLIHQLVKLLLNYPLIILQLWGDWMLRV